MIKKKCFKCREEKELKEFYCHAKMKDGHLNKCKECAKKDEMLFRIEHPDRLRAIERKRTKKRMAYIADRAREWRNKYPEKYRAHYLLTNAVRDGRIIKPKKCEICNSDFHIHAHHNDYSKPLEVVWICAKCHGQIQ